MCSAVCGVVKYTVIIYQHSLIRIMLSKYTTL